MLNAFRHRRSVIGLFFLLIPWTGLRAQYDVTNTNDSGPGSLRQVMTDANGQPWSISIHFQIPKSDPGFNPDLGVWTIRPQSPLPLVYAAALNFNGETQAVFIGEDTNPLGPEIEIDGSLAGENADGLRVRGCNAVNFYLITVNRFSGTGIWIENVSGGGYVAGCYVGTDPTGMIAAPNGTGVTIDHCGWMRVTRYDTIPTIASGNLNYGLGFVNGSSGNQVYECVIGLNRTGTEAIGNGNYGGILICNRADSNYVTRNVISGNSYGVYVYNARKNELHANNIGGPPGLTAAASPATWAHGNTNDGITLAGIPGDTTEHTVIDENTIAFNGAYGVRLNGGLSRFNTFRLNAMWANGAGAIGLLEGANEGIVPPVLTGFDGTFLYGTTLPSSRVEIFTDDGDQARQVIDYLFSGPTGEFQKYLAGESLLAHFTATVTDATGNTSALSDPFIPVSAVRPAHGDPSDFRLDPVFPNPFNPAGTVRFSLDRPCRVSVTVVNLRGETLAVLKDGPADAGVHSVTLDASAWPSGRYWVRMEADGSRQTRVRPFSVAK